jgi:hypothetical protein
MQRISNSPHEPELPAVAGIARDGHEARTRDDLMASEKRRKKLRALERKLHHPAAAKPPKDGDRRHRHTDNAREAQKRKQAERRWNIDSTPEGGGLF